MTQENLAILKVCSENGIAPEIVAVDRRSVFLKKYPMTLLQYCDLQPGNVKHFESLVDQLYDRLHALGILHVDAHGNNIVVDPETRDIRLIDFEHSMFVKDVTQEELDRLNEFLEPEQPFRDVADVMEFEKTMVD